MSGDSYMSGHSSGMAGESLRMAALQMCSQGDVADNVAQAGSLVHEAARLGAQVVLLPEACFYLGPEANKAAVAEPFLGSALSSGPMQRALADWARALGVWLIAGGVPERSPDPARPFNSSLVVSPDGAVVERYRKMHLFDVDLGDGTSWKESNGTTPGDALVVAQVAGATFGLSICYDVRFPQLYSWARRMGAAVLTVPAAFTRGTGAAHWHLLLRARAVETQCFVVAAAQEGTHYQGRETYGHTLIVDPWGRVIAEREQAGPGVVMATLELDSLGEVRRRMPMAAHPHLFVSES